LNYNLLMPMRAVKHYDTWIGDGHLADIARLGEDAGFDGIATTDHPFPDDKWLAEGGHHSFDPFVALSFMAAATRRIKLLSFILVAGYRNPYITAKSLASLDKLSGSRVIAGMAAGYLRSEFDALGATWDGRGKLFDAALDAMHAAWTGQTVNIEGPFAAHGHTQLPMPSRAAGPPIWVGGNSAAARRRAVERGDGWLPIAQGPEMAKITKTLPLTSIAELAGLVTQMQADRAKLGKPSLEVCFSPFGDPRDFPTFTAKVRADLPAYEDAGVTWLTFEPHVRGLAGFREQVAAFSDEIITRA
jgi:probable F420-dependent oxidoreductase